MIHASRQQNPPNTCEAEIKASPTILFADENLGSYFSPPSNNNPYTVPQLVQQQNLQRVRSPIRRLNFEHEAHLQSNNVALEINKVTEFKRFNKRTTSSQSFDEAQEVSNKVKIEEEPAANEPMIQEEKEHEARGTRFYRLRSSPIQMFNSFSPNASYLSQTIGQKFNHGSLVYSEGKLMTKKMCCNCKKSHCLKLYCECFSNKSYCSGCNCVSCLNTQENEAQREKAMQATLERNPIAFDPKITRAGDQVWNQTLIFILGQ